MATTPATSAARAQRGRPGEVDGERLLAHDVLAGGQRGLDQRAVQVVGRADVDDVDLVGRDELGGVVEAALGAEAGDGALGALGRGRHDTDDAGARPGATARACTVPMKPVPMMPSAHASAFPHGADHGANFCRLSSRSCECIGVKLGVLAVL